MKVFLGNRICLARCFLDLLVVRQAEPKFRTLWRGRESRAVKIEPCVASAEGSTFLTHRPRPATQGSIFSARSARRVREKGTWSWPRISNRRRFPACSQRGAACNASTEGFDFLAHGLAWRRRVRISTGTIRARARGFEISVGRGKQPKI